MKKLILLVPAIALILGAGAAADSHYDQDQINKTKQEQTKVTKLEQQLAAEQETSAKRLDAYQSQRIQCEKGFVAYGYVSESVVKAKKIQAPKCGAAVIE